MSGQLLVFFSSSFLYQITKKTSLKKLFEEKSVCLNGYCHYAVLHMHTQKKMLSILSSLTFASVALKVSIKSVVFYLLVGCL